MTEPVGVTATRIHLLLVAAFAFTGLVLLAIIGVTMLSSDAYSRDMGLLGAIITAPIWLVGIVATVDAVSVLRGRPVSRRRALSWALVAIAGAGVLAWSSGQLALLVAMVSEPHRVGVDWPAVMLVTPDGLGVQYLYADQPAFWVPLIALPVAIASIAAVGLDRTARRSEPARA